MPEKNEIEILYYPLMAVRKRPHMYVGTTDAAGVAFILQGLIAALCTNSKVPTDLHISPTYVKVSLSAKGRFTMECDGNGIPTRPLTPIDTAPIAVALASDLYAPGFPFWSELAIMNGLGCQLSIESHSDDRAYRITFERGKLKQGLTFTGASDRRNVFTWTPDSKIFGDINMDIQQFRASLMSKLQKAANILPMTVDTLES